MKTAVYDKGGKKILVRVSINTTSIGASKAAGVKSTEFTIIKGRGCWIVKED